MPERPSQPKSKQGIPDDPTRRVNGRETVAGTLVIRKLKSNRPRLFTESPTTYEVQCLHEGGVSTPVAVYRDLTSAQRFIARACELEWVCWACHHLYIVHMRKTVEKVIQEAT